MKTNKIYHFIMMATVVASLSFAGCKKNESESATTVESASQQQMAADEMNQNIETENSMNEVNDVMASIGLGKTSIITNATVDSSDILFKRIIIHYNGTSADSSRIRTGDIVVQLSSGKSWKDQLATLTILYQNYTVIRMATGRKLTFEGTLIATNITGGTAFIDPTVVHTVETTSSGLDITFDDGTSKLVNWHLSRKRTFTNFSGVMAESLEGTGNAGGHANLLVWGKNRNDTDFYAQNFGPIVYNATGSSKCPGLFISGTKVFPGIRHEITLTLGLDKSGNMVDANSSNCPGYYKIEWKDGSGNSQPLILPY